MNKIILWVLVLFSLTSVVLALGVEPAKTTIYSEEVSIYEGEIKIINEAHTNINAKIFSEGALKDFITLDISEASLTPNDDHIVVPFKVKLPPNLPPGETLSYITIEQDLFSQEENVVSSKIALKHKLIVKGPFPDKYLETKLNFHETPEKINLVSEVFNRGKKGLDNVQTEFFINGNEQQITKKTEKVSLPTKQSTLLKAEIDRQTLDYGEFEVKAVTNYDDLTIELTKTMVLGSPDVEITYFNPYFIAHKINPYSLELLNKWNKKVENVFVDVEIKKDGKTIDKFRTKSTDIDAKMSRAIEDYYDARDKGEGEYSFEMVVNFLNLYQSAQKKFTVELMSEEEFNNALTGAVTASPLSSSSTFFWVLLIILVGLIGGYIGYRYAHRHNYEGGEKPF